MKQPVTDDGVELTVGILGLHHVANVKRHVLRVEPGILRLDFPPVASCQFNHVPGAISPGDLETRLHKNPSQAARAARQIQYRTVRRNVFQRF